MDVFGKIDRLMETDLGKYAKIGHGYLTFPKLTGEIGPKMYFEGKEVLCWSLNNYLGLANDPEIRKTDAEAAAQYGLAYPMGSRMLTGNTRFHEEFEALAADYEQKQDAFLLNYGYQGCVSIIQALTDRRDVIVYDQLSHACIIDGMMQSLAKRFVYPHNDMNRFEDRLKKAAQITAQTGGGIFVVTEGVFGMKGDMGVLDQIVAFKSKYDFRILIDDAHGFGIMGAGGRGTSELFNVLNEIDLYFTTFAKSMAMIGAFVAGDKKVIDFLRYNMRSQIYAKALPITMAIGAVKRIQMIRAGDERRRRLWEITRMLQKGLRERGFDLGVTQTPVTTVYLKGTDGQVVEVVRALREEFRLFVSVVTYPVIEKGLLMLRLIPTADHLPEHVDYTIEAFAEIRRRLRTNVEGAA
jgi:glycine C-acetyltransferase